MAERGPFVAHTSLFPRVGEVPDIEASIDAASYRETFGSLIGDSILAFFDECELATGPFVSFTGSVAQTILAASGASLTAKLDHLLGKYEVDRLIDSARVLTREALGEGEHAAHVDQSHRGPGRWFPNVAVALGSALHSALRESLNRIVPRYISTAVATGLAVEEATRQTLGSSPRVRGSDIIGSKPIDGLTIAALVSEGTFAYRAYRIAFPEELGQRGVLRLVTLRWEAPHRGTCWARVVAPSDPNLEEVAHALFGSSLRTPEILVAASPLFGVNNTSALLPSHLATLTARGPLEPGDGTVHVTSGPLADEIAKNQAVDRPVIGATRTDVLRTLGENLAIVRTIEAAGAAFGMGKNPSVSSMAALTHRLEQRFKYLAEASESEALSWAAPAISQQQVLSAVSWGLDREAKRLVDLMGMIKDRSALYGALELPMHVRNAMNHVAMRYAEVALISDASLTANALLATVEDEAAALPITFLEGTLGTIQSALDNARAPKRSVADHASYDVAVMAGREQGLRIRLAALRGRMAADPEGAAAELKAISELISDLQIETETVGTMDHIDAAWQALEDSRSVFASWATRVMINGAQAAGMTYHGQWKAIFARSKSDDPAQRAQARTDLAKLRSDPELARWLAQVREIIDDANTEQIIGRLAVVLAITVVTAGVGDLVAGAAVGWGLGTAGKVAVVATAEAVTSTVLTQVLLDDNHEGSHIVYEFGANLVTAGATRGFGEIAALKQLGKLPAIGGSVVIIAATTFAKAELDAQIANGRSLTRAEIRQVALEALVVAVATHAISPALRPLSARLEGAGFTFGVNRALASKIAAHDAAQLVLAGKARQLHDTRSASDALDYLTRERLWIEERIQILDEVEALAKHEAEDGTSDELPSHRPVSRRFKLKHDTLEALHGELAGRLQDVVAGDLATLVLEPKGAGLFTCPRDHIDTVASLRGTVTRRTIDPTTNTTSYEVAAHDGSVITIIERVDPAMDWISHLRTRLTPDANERLRAQLQAQSPADLMRRYRGSLDAAMRELGSGPELPLRDTVEMFCAGNVPRDPSARVRYSEIASHWPPERRALHDRLIAHAKAQAQVFADALKHGVPTLYAMRGNTAAGKTRAVTNNVAELAGPMQSTTDLQHRSVNPDNFKPELIAATGGRLTSQQVHAESSMLANRLQHELLAMRTTDGTELASILIDKRLANLDDVLAHAQLARETGRKFVLYDVDAPLQTSLAGVLERIGGQNDPVPNYEVVGKGFEALRNQRGAVIAAFERDPSLGRYELYGARDDGARVPVATVERGVCNVHDEALFAAATSKAGDMSDYIATVRLTDDVIAVLTERLPPERRAKVAAILRKYQGWTWKAALDAHSVQRPPLQPDDSPEHQPSASTEGQPQ